MHGTFLQGKRLKAHELTHVHDNDEITLGRCGVEGSNKQAISDGMSKPARSDFHLSYNMQPSSRLVLSLSHFNHLRNSKRRSCTIISPHSPA